MLFKINFKMIMFFLFLSFVSLSCQENSGNSIAEISIYNFNYETAKNFKLSKKLKEISGLATSPDGRLFAHNDELGIVYQLNLQNGEIIKYFSLGKKTVKEDFEGITIAGERFFLVTSSGTIYEFTEGEQDQSVEFMKYKTPLKSKADVEGFCYDPDSNSLLLACKGDPGKGFKGRRAIYSFSLDKMKLDQNPRFLISIDFIMQNLKKNFLNKLADFFLLDENSTFAPSAIEWNAKTKTFFVLASKGKALLEVSPQGKITGIFQLDPKVHHQPEGLAFTDEFSMIICDEGRTKKAQITIYPLSTN